jgi:GTP-binding protein
VKIKHSEFVKSLTELKDKPELRLPEFAFIGRSNVGKSTLINSLLQRKNLAKTSVKPGKTQLINYFIVNSELYFVDLPGYGFAKVPLPLKKKWEKFIETYLSKSEDLKCLFLLIDGRHPLKDNDYAMIEWLEYNRMPYQIVFTKTDKVSQKEFYKNVKAGEEKFNLRFNNLFIPYSAKTGKGREAVLGVIEKYLQSS